jgi:hypothetical protein
MTLILIFVSYIRESLTLINYTPLPLPFPKGEGKGGEGLKYLLKKIKEFFKFKLRNKGKKKNKYKLSNT